MTSKNPIRSAATARNKAPILEVLERVLPASGTVVEIASGYGEHVVHFAAALPGLRFVPTDASADGRVIAAEHIAEAGLPNVEPPRELDVTWPDWPDRLGVRAAAIVCINMIHIAPIEALAGLVRGAGALLGPGAPLVLYGPYRFHGVFLAPSNAAFSEDLKSRNPAWGVRDIDDVAAAAAREGFRLEDPIPMPANNHVVVLRRT